MTRREPNVLGLSLRRDRWSLRFTEPFESQYQHSAFQQSRHLLRLAGATLLGSVAILEGVAVLQIPEIALNVKVLGCVFYSCLFAASLLVLSFRENCVRIYEHVLVFGTVFNHVAMMWMATAYPPEWIRTSFAGFVLLLIVPMIVRIRLHRFVPMQLACAAFIAVAIYQMDAYPTVTGRPIAAAIFLLTAVVASIVGSGIIESLARREFLATQALEAERQKSDALLRNVMPDRIARRLMAGEADVADSFGEVTIMFADLSGFTNLSESKSPRTLVAILNEIFACFDDLVMEHRLEKIKTMGDAYMAVAGLGGESVNHAAAAVDCGLAMLRALEVFNAANATDLKMKVGIHSGPVVAGVIGKSKFAYDIWGDAVNVASRMESHGIPGRIQVSAATQKLIDATHRCSSRGLQDIKGKGKLPTWLVDGRIPAHDRQYVG